MNITERKLRGCSRHPRALLVVLALAGAAWAGPARAAVVAPSQETVALVKAHAAYAQPSFGATRVDWVRATRPITDERTVLPVLDHRAGAGVGGNWLRVRLPGRPNGRTGWIDSRGTTSASTDWHLVVETSARRVVVYLNGTAVRTFSVVVGKPSTPTPRGEFFVEETILLQPGDAGAPYALALSARSNVLQEFDGGPGQIALHGLRNVGGTLGTAASHGCVRLDNAAVQWLADRIGPGVPVTIT